MYRLRDLRKERKLSMKKLGELIGLSESTVSLYETGKREPDNETLMKLADYFEVSVDYLLGRTDDPSPKTLDEQLQGVEFALWGEVKEMTEGQKRDVLNYARFRRQQEGK